MATFALTNQTCVINSVDLSDHCRGVTVVLSAEQLDATAMSSTGWKTYKGGLKEGTVNIEFLDDFVAGSVDATIFSAFNTGTAVAMTTKPVAGANSANNPELQFSILPNAYNAGGSIGQLAGKTISFPITGAVTRAVV